MSHSGLSKARLSRMSLVMHSHVDSGAMPGLVALVSRHGETHIDAIGMHAVGGAAAPGNQSMRRDSIFRVASMIKPITAAAAMILIEECRLRLDDAIDEWLPELANRRVLKRIDAPLEDTVPALRPISVRDLLTFRMGFGSIMAAPDTYPIQTAMRELKIGGDGPPNPADAPASDEWLRRLGSLPLMSQPGERWLYNTGSDVLGILIERASGQPFERFLRERLFEPLGMRDAGFYVPEPRQDRLTISYIANRATGALEVYDSNENSQWGAPPPFHSGAGGLVCSAVDYLAFLQMLLNKGRVGSSRILSRPSVELMITDQLTQAQRSDAGVFFNDNSGWGFGMRVQTRRDNLYSPGRFGWEGGLGTTAYADPAEGLIGILLTPRMMDSPQPPKVMRDFWTCVYQAIDD